MSETFMKDVPIRTEGEDIRFKELMEEENLTSEELATKRQQAREKIDGIKADLREKGLLKEEIWSDEEFNRKMNELKDIKRERVRLYRTGELEPSQHNVGLAMKQLKMHGKKIDKQEIYNTLGNMLVYRELQKSHLENIGETEENIEKADISKLIDKRGLRKAVNDSMTAFIEWEKQKTAPIETLT